MRGAPDGIGVCGPEVTVITVVDGVTGSGRHSGHGAVPETHIAQNRSVTVDIRPQDSLGVSRLRLLLRVSPTRSTNPGVSSSTSS